VKRSIHGRSLADLSRRQFHIPLKTFNDASLQRAAGFVAPLGSLYRFETLNVNELEFNRTVIGICNDKACGKWLKWGAKSPGADGQALRMP
jgi:hypothetical protein